MPVEGTSTVDAETLDTNSLQMNSDIMVEIERKISEALASPLAAIQAIVDDLKVGLKNNSNIESEDVAEVPIIHEEGIVDSGPSNTQDTVDADPFRGLLLDINE